AVKARERIQFVSGAILPLESVREIAVEVQAARGIGSGSVGSAHRCSAIVEQPAPRRWQDKATVRSAERPDVDQLVVMVVGVVFLRGQLNWQRQHGEKRYGNNGCSFCEFHNLLLLFFRERRLQPGTGDAYSATAAFHRRYYWQVVKTSASYMPGGRHPDSTHSGFFARCPGGQLVGL